MSDAAIERRAPDALSKIVGTGDTRAMLEQVERNVRDVIDIARDRGFVTRFNNRDFFGFPAWSLLALTYGLVPFVEWTKPVEGGWEARAVVRTRDGDVVSSAEAMCTRRESSRKAADDHTLRAMAQTRAMRNALRSCLGAALVMAGFDFADPEGPITKEQLGLLHQLERELGWSHEQGHIEAGDVASYRDLTREEASVLIDRWTEIRDGTTNRGQAGSSTATDDPSQTPAPDHVEAAVGDAAGTGSAGLTSSEPVRPSPHESSGGTETRLPDEGAGGPSRQRSAYGEGVSGGSEGSPAPTIGNVDEAWARAPHDMSRTAALKLARKMHEHGRLPGDLPKSQAAMTADQVAKVSAAYRDGERG